MKIIRYLILAGILSFPFGFGGCSSIEEYPRYDRELVYQKPYDLTYLRALEALNSFPNWILEETDKEKGIIAIQNTEFGHLFDRDKANARFVVKRIGRNETSVALEPGSQTIQKGGEFLERIDQYMQMT